MFKFLKSKKGFTLVELMIVVVIMAILVAVAVPIYSAVTANARKKTCIGNQRNIISQINTNVMSGAATLNTLASGTTSFDVIVYTNATGDGLATDKGTDNSGIADPAFAATVNGKDSVTFIEMFNSKNMPFCPTDNGQVKATITPNADGGCTVVTSCESKDSSNASLGHTM